MSCRHRAQLPTQFSTMIVAEHLLVETGSHLLVVEAIVPGAHLRTIAIDLVKTKLYRQLTVQSVSPTR